MSTRAMVFIDGTWLAVSANRLAEQLGVQGRTGAPLDFGALPRVCAEEVAAQMAVTTGLDVVRTHYFGSIATNFDPVDGDAVQRRSDFFDSLRRHHRYEVYRYETDYRGHRVRRTPGDDGFSPPEKAVDVGLATTLLEMAAVSAYDIAIVICGDRDFVPALQAVRRLGKRVAIVSVRGSCAREFSDPNDPLRVRDFDTLWLDTLWARVVAPGARSTARLTSDEPSPDAESAAVGGAEPHGVASDESPYAADTVASPSRPALLRTAPSQTAQAVPSASTGPCVGVVTKLHTNGYGFVRGDDGFDYYFRRSDLAEPADFARLERFRTRLTFRVSEPARAGNAGRAVGLAIADSGTGSATDGSAMVMARPTPAAVPAVRAPSYDDLWDIDPFAARPRREPPPSLAPIATEFDEGPEARTGHEMLEAPESLDGLPTPVSAQGSAPEATEVAALPVDQQATPPVETVTPPARKKRAPRKTLSA